MTPDDLLAVGELLGRQPEGAFEVVARSAAGGPVVIRNAPFLGDGTPMPTRYWLVGREEVRAVSQLESVGAVRAAEAELDPQAIADAHARYALERDAAVAEVVDHDPAAPVPTCGVGGTRQGVKCLHAHYAWHLAGGDDPVGRWVADHLPGGSSAQLDIIVAADATTFRHGGDTTVVPVGPATLVAAELRDPDPPQPAQLTNALGLLADHLDDVLRAQPSVADVRDVRVAGDEPWHLLVVERGGPAEAVPAVLGRAAAEEVFRLLATETRAQRLANPGLDPARVDTVLGTCCVLLAVMRGLRLDQVAVSPALQVRALHVGEDAD